MTMSTDDPVSIDRVNVTYAAGDAPVLTDFSVHPPPGTITVICGGSGSGKSSVLRVINGLIPHFHTATVEGGTVMVSGRTIADAPLHSIGKLCATVFQNPKTQFFTTDVDSELAFAGQNYRVPAEEIRRRSAQALTDIGIRELAGRGLNELSGGQLQKVACAQALTQDTPVLLFDEPTSNLDPDAIDTFTDVLAKLKQMGKTIIIAEHRLYFLKGLVDQVIVLENGRVAHEFSGEEFFNLDQDYIHTMGLRSLTRPLLLAEPLDSRGAGSGDVSVDKLRVNFGKTPVLDLSGMCLPAGYVTGIVGPNGCGKTTFARALCGLQKTSRDTTIRGCDSAFLVMQDVHRQLFRESVVKEAPLEYLEAVDLAEFSQRHPLSLSGGQQQRLVCATALSQDSHVVIFDEPTSGVDYRHLRHMAALLKHMAEQGRVVVVISHDSEFLNYCADFIVRFRHLHTWRNPS